MDRRLEATMLPRVAAITTVPDPNGDRMRAILALLLEAGLTAEVEVRDAG